MKRINSNIPLCIPLCILLFIVVAGAVLTYYALKNEPTTKKTQTPMEEIASKCAILSERYGFPVPGFTAMSRSREDDICGKYIRSEERARQRLAELRKNQPPGNYCEAKEDFQDAYDLERWILNDAAFRMERIGVKDDELRDRRILTARMFAAEINRRIQIRNYDGTNCGAPLYTDNFVFARHPSITVTEFGHIGADYEEVRTALYWRRMQHHGPIPHYRELPRPSDVEAARKAVDAAYDRKYGKH